MTGVLPVDKPEGPTSHDVVQIARRSLGIRRVGHTGTLDPFASGLLLLCVGSSTRLAEYLSELPKEYVARARLGVRTTTDDRVGEVIETAPLDSVTPRSVKEGLESLVGDSEQVPPAFSAKKVEGDRAYRLARRGEPVALAGVPVTVYEIEVGSVDLPHVEFRVRCSSGTYVRALARDLGERLGTGGHLVALRRTAIGWFRVEDALTLDELSQPEAVTAATIAPIDAVAHLTGAELRSAQAETRLRHGQSIPVDEVSLIRVTDPARLETLGGEDVDLEEGRSSSVGHGDIALAQGGRLVAIVQRSGDRILPRKVFPVE